jgi:hypothetical protein
MIEYICEICQTKWYRSENIKEIPCENPECSGTCTNNGPPKPAVTKHLSADYPSLMSGWPTHPGGLLR